MKKQKPFIFTLAIVALLAVLTLNSCSKSDTPTTTTTSNEIKIGNTYQGGKVAYIFQPLDTLVYVAGQVHGLIAAPSDQSTAAPWGCINIICNVFGTNIGKGNPNTTAIMTACATPGIAARLCGDLVLGGYSDWYLPSKEELNQLYKNKAAIGGFNDNNYWCSSETGSLNAFQQFFLQGAQTYDAKDALKGVRAVRSF